ncbi:MAG: type II secretion system protein [Armatimonadetes bacterium]|nr:type II secretion system protein [Armatimonadota bacterium]
MRRRRGMTLVELIVATGLTAVIVGTLAAFYALVTIRSAHSAAKVSVVMQAQSLADEIARTIEQSVECDLVSQGGGIKALKCIMPAQGTDTDGDGRLDTFWPQSVSAGGNEKFGEGKRVWFYMADSSAAFKIPGPILWRAERNDDVEPTPLDVDKEWSYYYDSGRPKWHLVESVEFDIVGDQLATFTINLSSLTRADKSAIGVPADAAAPGADRYLLTLTRTVFWRNWRK